MRVRREDCSFCFGILHSVQRPGSGRSSRLCRAVSGVGCMDLKLWRDCRIVVVLETDPGSSYGTTVTRFDVVCEAPWASRFTTQSVPATGLPAFRLSRAV